MASRYGWEVRQWLLARGWLEGRGLDEGVCGDAPVRDPVTGRDDVNVYEAVRLHRERTGEYPEWLEGR